MSLLIDFCNDYRTYLCWKVSSILFSIIQVLMSICFNLSFLGTKKQNSLHHQPPPALWHNWKAYRSRKKKKNKNLHSLLILTCSSITKVLQWIYSIVQFVGCLAYNPSGTFSLWLNCMEYKRNVVWTTAKLKYKASQL